MDQATRKLRARNKRIANPKGQLPEFEARGLGRKLKSAETFPARQCDYIEGGVIFFYRTKRENKRTHKLENGWARIIKGGERCHNTATVGHRCLNHVGAKYVGEEDE